MNVSSVETATAVLANACALHSSLISEARCIAEPDEGDISVPAFDSSDLMRAIYRLKAYPDAYLYIAKPVEKGIINHLLEAESSLVSYREAAASRARIQTVFALSYVETALLVLVTFTPLLLLPGGKRDTSIGRGAAGSRNPGNDLIGNTCFYQSFQLIQHIAENSRVATF